jgi:hypothetical protein
VIVRIWLNLLNWISSFEAQLEERLGALVSVLAHFLLFWGIPIMLVSLRKPVAAVAGLILAALYVFILCGDVMFSAFGHPELDKKQGMLDIKSVREVRDEITGALVKYLGAIVSFASMYCSLETLSYGTSFVSAQGGELGYFDFLYFSLVTIATVGYGDIVPRTIPARIFCAGEIFFGFGFVILVFSMLITVYIDLQRQKRGE